MVNSRKTRKQLLEENEKLRQELIEIKTKQLQEASERLTNRIIEYTLCGANSILPSIVIKETLNERNFIH